MKHLKNYEDLSVFVKKEWMNRLNPICEKKIIFSLLKGIEKIVQIKSKIHQDLEHNLLLFL